MADAAPFTRDDFARWLEDPVTKWVGQACGAEAKHLQDTWVDISWVGGRADEKRLAEMRGMAAALEANASPRYESLCEIMGVEPRE